MIHLIYIIIILLLFITLLLYIQFSKRKSKEEHHHLIIHSAIENVLKIVVTENFQSDIIEIEHTREMWIGSSTKKMLVVAEGRVLIGFDLGSIEKPVVDKTSQTVTVQNLPKAEILAIEHKLRWYDIDNGWFNKFKKEDFTSVGIEAKEKMRTAVIQSGLLIKAEKKLIDQLKSIKLPEGWKLQLPEAKPKIEIDTKHKSLEKKKI